MRYLHIFLMSFLLIYANLAISAENSRKVLKTQEGNTTSYSWAPPQVDESVIGNDSEVINLITDPTVAPTSHDRVLTDSSPTGSSPTGSSPTGSSSSGSSPTGSSPTGSSPTGSSSSGSSSTGSSSTGSSSTGSSSTGSSSTGLNSKQVRTANVTRTTKNGVVSYTSVPSNIGTSESINSEVIEISLGRNPVSLTEQHNLNSTCKVDNIGINTAGLSYSGGEMPLKDLAKMSMGWIRPWGGATKNAELNLDSNGYLLSVDNDGAQTIISDDLWGRTEVDNNYVVLYDGEGELSFNLQAARVIKNEPGRIEIELKKGRAGMVELSTNPANHLRNIRIVPLKNEFDYEEKIVREDYKNVWSGVGVVRFLDALETNRTSEVTWGDRRTQGLFGHIGNKSKNAAQSIEDIIQMSNEMNTSPWLLAPHMANDDYFRRMAIYVKENLNPNLKVYIEYTNEAWNWGFPQTKYLSELANKNGTNQYIEYGLRAKRLFEIWTDVFGDRDRLVRVVSTQFYNPWVTEQIMKTPGLSEGTDALAVGYYLGHKLGSDKMAQQVLSMSDDDVFDYLNTDSLPTTKSKLIEQKKVADKYGLELVAYEAGQHLAAVGKWSDNALLVDKFIRLNKNPKMYQVYMNMYKNWNDIGGGLIVWFHTSGKSSKWGSWGLLENTYQDPATAPKFRAFKRMLSDNGCL